MSIKKTSSLGYAISFAVGLGGLTLGAIGAFWQVTGGEVRRSAAEAAEATQPRPVWVDTTTPWQPSPEVALLDTLYMLRNEGRLEEALEVVERWLSDHPDDRPIRLDGARIAFEAKVRARGVFHYRRYLFGGEDNDVLREAVSRILAELPPPEARKALTTLLRVDDAAYTARIGLARATADASDPVGADTLLRPIPPFADSTVDQLRLLVRRAQNPDISTAQQWVREYPDEGLYRLVLARALSRAGQPREALQHYVAAFAVDTSLALRHEASDVAVAGENLDIASGILADILAQEPENQRALLSYARVRARLGDNAGAVRTFERLMALNPDEQRYREARGVLFEVTDTELTIPLLARLVAFRPDDDVLRFRYAQDLEGTRQFEKAEVQYDTLLLRVPTAALYLTRARLRSARNDLDGAITDAVASERLEPSVDAALIQGDIHRWRQERELSRVAYARAAALAPDDARVTESRRLLGVQRREALAFEPEYGSAMTSNGITDSDGFESVTIRAQEGFAPLVDESVIIVGGEVRRTTGANGALLSGFGGDVGIARPVGGLQMLGRVGAVTFGGTPALTGLFEVTKRSQLLSLRGALTRTLAYESLRSGNVVAADRAMAATTLLGSMSAQLSPRVDLYVQADHARLGDGNARTVIAGAARRKGSGPFSLLYTASAATFITGTARYFSPDLFITQGLGVDARRDRREGWSVGARLAPSYAWVRESAPGRPAGMQGALQGTLSGDATWRRPGWEVGLFGGYGQDRAGTYQAAYGGLRARMTR